MASIPILSWRSLADRAHQATVLLDSSVDNLFNVALLGSSSDQQELSATVCVIDNMGNNGTVYFTYGISRYQVAPYTRKSIYLQKNQTYIIFTATVGVVTLTFCDFDPDLPEETNQVATNTAGGSGSGTGGGPAGSTYTAFNPTDYDSTHLNLSTGNLEIGHKSASVATMFSARTIAYKATGKFYFEATYSYYGSIGIANSSYNVLTGTPGTDPNSAAMAGLSNVGNGNGNLYRNGASLGAVESPNTGYPYTHQYAIDRVNGLWWSNFQGQWNMSPTADPGSGVGGIAYGVIGDITIIAGIGQYGTVLLNTGSSPWAFSAPTGFVGWTA